MKYNLTKKNSPCYHCTEPSKLNNPTLTPKDVTEDVIDTRAQNSAVNVTNVNSTSLTQQMPQLTIEPNFNIPPGLNLVFSRHIR